MKIESSLRVFCCTETPGEPGRRRYEFGAQVRPFLPPARPLLLNFAHGAHALRFLPYQGTRPTAHFTTIPSHGRLLSSCWQSSARWSASRTSEGGDRASKTCSAVLCAGLQPKVTWVGLSLKGSPLASASVRLTPGPRNGAHFRAAAAVAAAPAATIAASAASDRLRRTAASPPPPPSPLTPPPPQPPPSLLCPPDRRRCRQCRRCQLHARARAAASPRARVRALASSRALSAPHSTAQHSASSMRELACELHFCKRELCAPCSKDR
jgi:hypothetical protein